VLHSSATKPPEIFVQANKPGAKAVQVTASTTEEFGLPWAEPEVLSFKARDGATSTPASSAEIPASGPSRGHLHPRRRLPPERPQGLELLLPRVMFHNLLLEKGYFVFDVDYRGSAGYGRDCRTGIYRAMGRHRTWTTSSTPPSGWCEERRRRADRIGTYGGSYGGF
jgi:dipeptidyl aminopeptidase/acylaminoacyl peptidase